MDVHDPTLVALDTSKLGDREVSLEEMQQILEAKIATEAITPPKAEQLPPPQPSAAEAAALPFPRPFPFPFPKLPVSGRYRSPAAFFQLELRVDADSTRPLNMVSGDFYQINGGTTTYFGSFVVRTPSLNVTPTLVTIRGLGQFTFNAGAPVVQVTIPRVLIFSPPAPATLQFFTVANQPGAIYVNAFESRYFRTVQYERGRASDVTTPEFLSYNTASLPSGGPNRILSVQKAYAEAGIEVQVLPEADLIDITEAGANAQWSDSELEASMQNHFDQFRDVPQWDVWEMVGQLHELGPGLYGIMFDYQDAHQRQGCAVFHAGIGGTTNDKLRLQLYTYAHELGHSFNLMHSWQKSLANPPGTDRPAALSWMNYPWRFPGGATAFWNAFPFQFDDGELAHLRHAFRNNVIMGGADFGSGAGLQDPRAFATPVRDTSGLQLEISVPHSTLLGEPVVVSLKLSSSDTRGKVVHGYLHPRAGLVRVAIQRPSGEVQLFQPIMEHCVGPQQVQLDRTTPSLEDSAYIGYGKDGQYFTQTGLYRIRATYYAVDGSQVVSNIVNLRVRNPVTAEDEAVADLLIGDQQGKLFALLGSDSRFLQSGNKALDEILAKHANHRCATYVRLAKGVNAGRQFKTVIPAQTKVELRQPQHAERIELLSKVEAAAATTGIDPVTLDQVRAYLSESQKYTGDEKSASATAKKITHKVAIARAAGAS